MITTKVWKALQNIHIYFRGLIQRKELKLEVLSRLALLWMAKNHWKWPLSPLSTSWKSASPQKYNQMIIASAKQEDF